MTIYSSKLVIIRGNSCSGKSTAAEIIRNQSKNPRKVALIGQDHFRRTVLKEMSGKDKDTLSLLKTNVIFCLEKGYDVILEGILKQRIYGQMINELIAVCPNHYVFYIDVSLAETQNRRLTRTDGDQFTNKQMAEWYLGKDVLGTVNEKIYNEKMTQQQIVEDILKTTSL